MEGGEPGPDRRQQAAPADRAGTDADRLHLEGRRAGLLACNIENLVRSGVVEDLHAVEGENLNLPCHVASPSPSGSGADQG